MLIACLDSFRRSEKNRFYIVFALYNCSYIVKRSNESKYTTASLKNEASKIRIQSTETEIHLVNRKKLSADIKQNEEYEDDEENS